METPSYYVRFGFVAKSWSRFRKVYTSLFDIQYSIRQSKVLCSWVFYDAYNFRGQQKLNFINCLRAGL